MHYYKFNIGDYKRDTAHLNPIEHYIYRSLLDWYYLEESPIPNETRSVLRRLGLGSDSDKLALTDVLTDFFKLDENRGGWVNGRCDEVIEEYHATALKNQENGKKGGRPRKKKPTENPVGSQTKPDGNPNESQKNPNQEPITNNHKPSKRNGFAPPSLEEVSDYIKEKGYMHVNPGSFMAHYSANGWMVGKNKMKCWKSALSGWEARAKEKHPSSQDSELQQRIRNAL